MQRQLRSIADQFVDEAVTALSDDSIVSHESHENGPMAVIRTNGTETPTRLEIRGPSFSNQSVLPAIVEGEPMATLIAARGSLRTIKGEMGR